MTIEGIRYFCENDFKFLNYQLKVREREPGQVVFELEETMPDNTNRSTTIRIMTQKSIPLDYIQSEEHLVEYLWRFVNDRIRHECGELFQIKGQTPYNEHNDTQPHDIIKKIYAK